MTKIHTIFTHGEGELGVDDDLNLYWNKKIIVTEQKITLQWWVNIAIILASMSTTALAVFALFQFLGYGGAK